MKQYIRLHYVAGDISYHILKSKQTLYMDIALKNEHSLQG